MLGWYRNLQRHPHPRRREFPSSSFESNKQFSLAEHPHVPHTQQGIGPEISESVKQIFTAAKVPIVWEEVDVTPTIVDGVSTIPADAVASIRKNTIALKGPLATPSKASPPCESI